MKDKYNSKHHKDCQEVKQVHRMLLFDRIVKNHWHHEHEAKDIERRFKTVMLAIDLI